MPIGSGVSLPVGERVELKSGVRYHLRGWGTLRYASGNWVSSYAAEKSSVEEVAWRPYRKPTLVDWGKSPKAFEATIVKELGKLTP